MAGTTDDERDAVAHATERFGWHGGTGDPPHADDVLAIVRGTVEFLHEKREEERRKVR